MNGFVDETTIVVSSGSGGDGAVSFRREKYVPRGGPDGGDGGKGGDVVFAVRSNLKTLSHLKLKRHYRAGDGGKGGGQKMHGKDGADVEVPVPPGTVLRDPETGETIADLTLDRQTWLFLRGGRGGKGNSHYATSVNQAPRYAQKGIEGQTRELRAELHLIADIGLVGMPNAGKSTLLSVLTNAHPLIGEYAFTTRTPNLGLLRLPERDVILADIPGIIEGASQGRGLGLKFLRHIERCAALLFLVDCSSPDSSAAVRLLEAELATYSKALAARPRIVVGTKLDLVESSAGSDSLEAACAPGGFVGISAVTRRGIPELVAAIRRIVSERSAAHARVPEAEGDAVASPVPGAEEGQVRPNPLESAQIRPNPPSTSARVRRQGYVGGDTSAGIRRR